MPHLICTLNPITKENVSTTVPAGKSLSDSLKIPDNVIIMRNGDPYNGEALEDDDLINLIVPPQGGGDGKDGIKTGIIMAGVLASQFAFPGNPSLAAGIGLGNALGRAGLAYGVSLAANALVPPLEEKI